MLDRQILIVFLGIIPFLAGAQSRGQAHDLRRDADKSYDQKQYDAAEDAYRRATILDPDEKGVFNLGNSIFNQNRYEEAARQYEKAIDLIDDPKEKSKAYYNLGNAHFLNEKYDQSVDAYKRSLIANPDDLQAKQNLLMALREMKLEEQQQQQQQQQQNEQQEEQNQENQPQDQQSENEDQQEQQQPNENSTEDQQQEELEQKLSKEQAMQLLEIIDEEDQKVQEKLRKKEAGDKKKSKDW